ncbi:hypothetical protein Chor_016704, partial [Crotalus horridus]
VCFPTQLSFKVAIYSHWQATMLGKKPNYLEEWIFEVSESGRRRRPSARSRRLLLSRNSAAAILSKQKSRAPRQDTGSANAARGERPGRESGADNSGTTLGLSRATHAGETP